MSAGNDPLEEDVSRPRRGFSLLAVFAAVSAVELLVVLVVGQRVLGLTS